MTRLHQRLLLTLASAIALAGCGGPPIAATFTDEPVCADFALGSAGNKMRGGLRIPIHIKVLDGKTPVAQVLIFGKRQAADQSPPLMIPNGNNTYTIEWAQCENERAPIPVGKANRRDGSTSYECGQQTVYKTETLTTKKDDPSTYKLVVPAPPKNDCWKDTSSADTAATEANDAGAPDAAVADAEAPDASTEDASAPTDAGAAAISDALPAASASAAPAASAAPKASAAPSAAPAAPR